MDNDRLLPKYYCCVWLKTVVLNICPRYLLVFKSFLFVHILNASLHCFPKLLLQNILTCEKWNTSFFIYGMKYYLWRHQLMNQLTETFFLISWYYTFENLNNDVLNTACFHLMNVNYINCTSLYSYIHDIFCMT